MSSQAPRVDSDRRPIWLEEGQKENFLSATRNLPSALEESLVGPLRFIGSRSSGFSFLSESEFRPVLPRHQGSWRMQMPSLVSSTWPDQRSLEHDVHKRLKRIWWRLLGNQWFKDFFQLIMACCPHQHLLDQWILFPLNHSMWRS